MEEGTAKERLAELEKQLAELKKLVGQQAELDRVKQQQDIILTWCKNHEGDITTVQLIRDVVSVDLTVVEANLRLRELHEGGALVLGASSWDGGRYILRRTDDTSHD